MELEEKLKVVAEYDGYVVKDFGAAHIRYIEQARSEEPYYEWQLLLDSEYHASFDWSVPVYSKCIKELYEKTEPFTEAAGVLVALEQRANQAIQNDDKLAFFENLVNLITELQKAKQ